MPESFNQYNETDPLQKVIIGHYRGYRQEEAYVEEVNASQKNGELPGREQLESDFTTFAKVLIHHGIDVLIPDYVGKFVYDQLTPRDLGVTIGNKFVISNMAKRSRRYEAAGIFKHLLAMEGQEPNILIPPDPAILLEGGDIIVDSGYIFVGLSERTNEAGVQYLMDTFEPEFEVIPLPCKSLGTDENVLHLDCVFNPVGDGYALIYSSGLKHIPKAIKDSYKLIEIDRSSYEALAANVLTIDENLVISRDHPDCYSVNQYLQNEAGIDVTEIPFNGPPATGGSLRCCSLPLIREN